MLYEIEDTYMIIELLLYLFFYFQRKRDDTDCEGTSL